MPVSALNTLRHPAARKSLALLAALALLFAGFAQAAHFHKSDRGPDTHLQCLLCLHADRLAGPPEIPHAIGPTLAVFAWVPLFAAGVAACCIPRRYDARGPPVD